MEGPATLVDEGEVTRWPASTSLVLPLRVTLSRPRMLPVSRSSISMAARVSTVTVRMSLARLPAMSTESTRKSWAPSVRVSGMGYCQLPLPSTVSTASTLPSRLRVTVAPGSPLPCSSGLVSRVRSST